MSLNLILTYVFFGALAVQLIYWISFLRLIFRRKHKTNEAPVPITILVCASNEEANLRELIPLLLDQDHPDFEIVIVDDRSIDNTYEYLIGLRHEEENLKVVRVDTVPDHMNAKKYALLLGIKAASNDYIVLTDADCKPASASWAKEISSQYEQGVEFILGFSSYNFKWTVLNLLIQYETLLTGIQYLSAALWGSPYMGVGRNLSYKKSFFLQQNGFAGIQHIVGGDDDLYVNKYANDQNTRVCVTDRSIVQSKAKESWAAYLVQKRRHFSVGKYYRNRDKIRISLFAASQVLLWICFVTLLLTASNLHLILGGAALRLAVQFIIVGVASGKLSVRFPVICLPVIELIYTLFLPLVSIPALLSKKIIWS